MKIGSCGKRDIKDQFMMIDLVFKFSDNANPKVVGELTNQNSKREETVDKQKLMHVSYNR